MQPILTVFVSSTRLDLQPEREAFHEMLRRFRETKFAAIEYFSSRDDSAASVSEVRRCDLYIGLFGGRHGSGVAELEYRAAREAWIPCLIYCKEEAAVPPDDVEPDPAKLARLRRFKEELARNHALQWFATPAELAAKAESDLHRFIFDEYLIPLLQDAVRGECPTSEAQAILEDVRDLKSLGEDLIQQLGHARLLGAEAAVRNAVLEDSVTTQETALAGEPPATSAEAIDDIAGFLSGVIRAWRDATEIGLQVRYALTIASLHDVAGNMPPGLLAAAVEKNVCSADEALICARQMTDPCQRAKTLLGLAGFLPSPQSESLVNEVVGAVQSRSFQRAYGDVIADFVGPLTRLGRFSEALDLARAPSNQMVRTAALGRIVSELIRLGRAPDAVRVAKLIGDDSDRIRILRALALGWAESGDQDASLSAVLAVGWEGQRAALLMDVIPYLHGEALDRALKAALAFREPAAKARLLATAGRAEDAVIAALRRKAGSSGPSAIARMAADLCKSGQMNLLLRGLWCAGIPVRLADCAKLLMQLAEKLPFPERLAALERAIKVIAKAEPESEKAEALCQLWEHVARPEEEHLLPRAMLVALAIDDPILRRRALGGMSKLSEDGLRAVLKEVLKIDSGAQPKALADLIALLPAAEREEAAIAAVESAVSRPGTAAATGVVIRTAPYLPRPLPESSVARLKELLWRLTRAREKADAEWAIIILNTSPGVHICTWDDVLAAAVGALIEFVPQSVIQEMLDRACDLTSAIARCLPVEWIRAEMKGARTIGDRSEQMLAQVRLARNLPESGMKTAFNIAQAIPNEFLRSRALRELAADAYDPLLVRELIAAAEQAPEYSRIEILLRLAKYLPETELRTLIARIADMTSWPAKLEAASRLAPHLPPPLIEQLLAVFSNHPSVLEFGLAALSPLLPYLPPKEALLELSEPRPELSLAELKVLVRRLDTPRLEQALRDATRSSSDLEKARTLAAIAGVIADKRRPRVLKEALAAARAIGPRADVLIEIGLNLSGQERQQVLQEALAAARSTSGELSRSVMLPLAPHLPEADRKAVLGEVLTAARSLRDRTSRAKALTELLAVLPEDERRDLMLEALAAARAIPDQACRAEALVALTPYLPEELRVTVVREVSALDDAIRAQTFVALAPHLSGSLLRQAVAAVRTIRFEPDRSNALAALAGGLAKLPAGDLDAIWRDTLPVLATGSRSDLLADLGALAPVILALGGTKAVVEVFEAIEAVGRWWP